MPGAHPTLVVSQGKSTQAVAWYAWEVVRKDDTWLVSFVDLLIILIATLVVLIGQMMAQHRPPLAQSEPPTAMPPVIPSTTTIATENHEQRNADRPATNLQSRSVQLARLVQERFQGEVKAVSAEKGITLEISDAVLFDTARATLRGSASSMLIRLAATLQESGDALVAVEGHTDDRPVQNGDFQSNWELAAARAYAVTHFLIGQGLSAERLRAVSFADTRPTADNESAEGRAANRRVELRVEFLQE